MKEVRRLARFIGNGIMEAFSGVDPRWFVAGLFAATLLLGLALNRKERVKLLEIAQPHEVAIVGEAYGESVFCGQLFVEKQEFAPTKNDVGPGQRMVFGAHPPEKQTWSIDKSLRRADNQGTISGPNTLLGGGGKEVTFVQYDVPAEAKHGDYVVISIQRFNAEADNGKGAYEGPISRYVFPVVPR